MTQTARSWLTEQWTEKVREAISTITAQRPSVHSGAAGLCGDAPSEAIWFEVPIAIVPEAVLYVGAEHSFWFDMGALVLAAGPNDATPEDAERRTVEILSQASSALALVIGEKLGREVRSQPPTTCDDRVIARRVQEAAVALQVALPNRRSGVFYLSFSRELELAVESLLPRESTSAPRNADVLAQPSRTFDLLLEVELPVSISFGRAQLQLRDVLKLNSGSIVELNRTISEPVEIIVNNCVIARGEVVVVEGNYGVRIQQVISREDRLRTLN